MDALEDALLILDENVLYECLPPSSRRLINQAVFVSLTVIDPDTIDAQRTPLYDTMAELVDETRQTTEAVLATRNKARRPADKDESAQNDHDPEFRGRGSYFEQMAERAGFEPAMES